LVGEVFGAFLGGPKTFLEVRSLISTESGGTQLDEFLVLFPSVSGSADGGAGEDDEQIGFGRFHEWGKT
jgi:hypothetical protein